MSENERARVAPPMAGAVLTEQVNLLVDIETRAFLIGSKVIDNTRSEASVARVLIGAAIDEYQARNPREYQLRVQAGLQELDLRSERAA